MNLKITGNLLHVLMKLSFSENEAFSVTKKESMSGVALLYVSANLRASGLMEVRRTHAVSGSYWGRG